MHTYTQKQSSHRIFYSLLCKSAFIVLWAGIATCINPFFTIANAREITVAVWDFDQHTVGNTDIDETPRVTRALPEILAQHLLRYPGTRVVERSKLREILEEQKLASSNLSDDDTRIRLGQLSGARYMVFGSTLSIGTITRLDVRLVSVETSRVEAAFEISCPPAELPENIGQLAKDIASSLLGVAIVQSVREATAPEYPIGRSARVSNDTLEAFELGLTQMDRKEFEEAIVTFKKVLTLAPGFTPAERNIFTALEKLSTQ